MKILMQETSWGALAVNVLIVGVAAGFSEELLFRGAFQRLLTTGGMNRHLAVWAVAFVFSAVHMQFFGFFPRLLLGAYFGYLLLWTRNIWVPVAAHTLNNTIYVVTAWIQQRCHPGLPLDSEPEMMPWILVVLSTATTLVLLYFMPRILRSGEQ